MAAAYAALVSLMNLIDALERHPRPPISLQNTQVSLLTEKATLLEQLVQGCNAYQAYTTEADPLHSRIADAAYAAEDAIESHIVDVHTSGGANISSHALYEALDKVIEEMALLEKEAIQIKQTVGVQLQRNSRPTSDSLRSSSSVVQKSSMVGADDVFLQMKDKLTSHCRDLQIIPIVGMGGSGKTTLAINIYEDLLIKDHFHIRAWATISQEYSIREILIELLCHLNQDIGQDLSEDELGEKLYKCLFGRRYLVVMDDMWSIEAWDGVKRFLPNNENGSRIVITTRLLSLTSQLPSISYCIEMKLLDEDDSWNLLCKTVFGERECPIELEEIGKKIGRSCKGLALSIVVVGGFLARSEHTREFWEYIEENLNSVVNLESDEHCLKILHLSYKQLPIYLKPCFLYMGVFGEDEVIYVTKLIRLWVAEGFLKPINGKSLEELAEEYLEDLIGRNLILIHKMEKRTVKKCKIHDLLRDLCLREAHKERFYTHDNRQGLVNGQRRIVISKPGGFAYNMPCMSPTRPLIWNRDENIVLTLVLPSLCLRLLRIFLSFNFLPIASEEDVHQLVNSRFIALLGSPTQFGFPCSIWLFWNLQTVVVYYISITAPTDIWYMTNIRHVEIEAGLYLPDPPEDVQDDIVLGNLQTLGEVRNFKCSEQVVKRIPNIKKFICVYDSLDDDRYCLNNLGRLDKLENLKCILYDRDNLSGADSLSSLISFPYSLKKLVLELEKGRFLNGILDKIGELPLLQSLKLSNGTFEQGKWETTEGQFRSLKYLSLSICKSFQVWTTESSHFPLLHHLSLFRLRELEEIPLDFAEISTLQLIDVNNCSTSAVVSAKRILEEQEELYGEATLQVRVAIFYEQSQKKEVEDLASANFLIKKY